jgi:hypothetical protein
MGSISLETILLTTYKGIFTDGFEPDELTRRNIPVDLHSFFCQCMRNPARLQVAFASDEALEKALVARQVAPEWAPIIRELFGVGLMDEARVRADIVEKRPYMQGVFDVWTSTAMKHFTLTTVGIAIGHASIKRYAGEFADLSIWIN